MTGQTRDLRAEVAAAIKQAMRERRRNDLAALRTVSAAITNAEAVPTEASGPMSATSDHLAGAAVGVGAAEAERRSLSEADIRRIVQHEAADEEAAAAHAADRGEAERAETLRARAAVLRGLLA